MVTTETAGSDFIFTRGCSALITQAGVTGTWLAGSTAIFSRFPGGEKCQSPEQ